MRHSAAISDPGLRAGEWVEVRSKDEILRTLDTRGRLEELPFMPQMFHHCGKRFRVFKRAHKTCDTVNDFKGRRMKDAVHLEGIRCDGQAYGGCEAGCLIYWKEAWLRRASNGDTGSAGNLAQEVVGRIQEGSTGRCTEADVLAATQKPAGADDDGPAYVCQATQVPAATEPLPWWELRQYLEDYTSGNVGLGRMAKSLIYMIYRHRLINLGIGLGPFLRWLYDMFQMLWGGIPYPRREGKIPVGERTPTAKLDLQPGEWVRIKDYKAILATLDTSNKNRGMYFDAEMVPYCGRTYRVLRRVTKILNEKTGKMQKFNTASIILDGVVCESRYSECRLFCPRSVYPYWREIWLERISECNRGNGNRVATSSAD
jgi:hypothetical protein